ncbi:hypothetical protein GCK72_014192 [Caenorhabditis remanei]|uniref:Uncharacterized protein n=1 Tax=Caenorhabditis remanei TaxID=31234 RepID=A0A6A5GT25_CAERE|nr:hypothetical protein GCK72_014192 [Caenorhabditis remanei]KAF1757736.1 hypothetical protein GCK72_014192 [Caenorhabditis remanei]
MPTFIRHIGTRHIDGPAFVAKIDMVTCSAHCRANFDPSSEESFPCEGFNFRAGRNPVCEFFPATGTNENHTKSLKIEEVPTFYYEKVCLQIAKRCEESAYMFDVKNGYRIDETPIRIINASAEGQCMEECVKIQCMSFGFHHDAKRCSFYNSTRRDAVIIKDVKMDYYENNCVHPTARCPNGRIEFFVTRKADVPSFGISLGVKSIRSCMQACVNAGQFYCRSVQFDSTSNECFVSDETSDVAVPSTTLDIFEPFCVPRKDENTCNRPYSFEKMITTKLMNSSIIKEIQNQSTEKCLQKCINLENCKSVNYNVLTRSCLLLSTSKSDSSTVSDENFDYYDRSCLHVAQSATSSASSFIPHPPTLYPEVATGYKMVERGRQLSDKFENRTGVENVQDCWSICVKSEVPCKLISFSSFSNQCLLSTLNSTEILSDTRKFTKPSESFDTYATSASKPTTPFPSTMKSTSSTRPVTSTVPTTTRITTKSMSMTTTKSFKSTESLEDLNNIFDINENFMDTTTANSPTRSRAHALPNAETKSKNKSSESTSLLPIDPELVGLEDSTPIQLPLSSGIAHVDLTRLSVAANCLPQGINITFDLSEKTKYTGVVYASERFDQCRVFVKNSSAFSIFIPRPKHNSWCNAVELNNEMSTIIIMSNDRILPHDVTTKDDLFYQVSCQYNPNDDARVSKGIVVGGPSPVLITKKSQIHEKISLEITKDGHLVESVFVGESLVATVKSNVSADLLRIVDCTAHRVGGNGPPASVNLVADGCALLPAIMSPMRLTSSGWQSSLSAFRIDGSEQIDVVCIISICEEEKKCPPMACTSPKEREIRSTSEENSIRVDRRLLVKGDKNYAGSQKFFAPICIESSFYLPAVIVFLCSLASILVSIFLAFRKRRLRDAQVEELLSTPIPQDIGPKYIKTMSM